LYFIQRREVRKTSQDIGIAISLSRFIYNRESLSFHEKHATLQVGGTETSEDKISVKSEE